MWIFENQALNIPSFHPWNHGILSTVRSNHLDFDCPMNVSTRPRYQVCRCLHTPPTQFRFTALPNPLPIVVDSTFAYDKTKSRLRYSDTLLPCDSLGALFARKYIKHFAYSTDGLQNKYEKEKQMFTRAGRNLL